MDIELPKKDKLGSDFINHCLNLYERDILNCNKPNLPISSKATFIINRYEQEKYKLYDNMEFVI